MDKKSENIGDLGEFFNIIGKAKKQKEDEFRSVVGDINLDGIFDNLKEENKKIKKKKKKEKKQIEQLEKFLFEDVDKKEEPKKEEIPEDQEIPDENTKVGLTEKVEEVKEEIVAEVESEEIQENDHVDEAIKVLDKIVSNKEEISEETDYELIKKEIKELRTLIHRNVNGTSGGGEVRLEFLDDVDRDTAKVDGKFLKYDSSSGKFVGASGGAGSQGLNDTLGIGNTSDIGMSVGVVTATSFVGNGVSLTGIVTSIVAGSNVTISGSTGRVTINASSGGGGTGGKFNDDQTNSGIHTTSSNVGLGTTNPRYQLEVGSVGAGGTQLWVNGDARITGILSVGTATITLDPTTNKVQIGTGITIDATTNTIEVAGSKIADNSGNAEFTGIVTATTVQVGSATTIHSSGIDLGNGNITSHNINSTGTITSAQLNVSGVSTFQSHVHLGDDDELRFGASNDFKIVHDPNDCRFENSNGDIKFKNTGNYFFFDEDGGETLASFINDGAINLFHSGNKKFETTASGIDITGHTETDTFRVSGISTFSGDVNFDNATLYVDSTNNRIGVGTNSPSRKLVVQDSGDTFLSVKAGTSDDVGVIFGDTDNDARGLIRYANNGDSLRLWTAGTEKVRILSSGDFGINTTNPSAKLDVNGTVNISGVATFQSHIHLGDADEARFGDSNDLKIYHSTNSVIANTTGNLIIAADKLRINNGNSSQRIIQGDSGGAASLWYSGDKKFETTGIGVSVSSGAGLTATIAGPTNLILDPAAVGDNTGIVRIKGDLYVDGTEVKVDSTTINLADHKVGIATTCGTNLLLDGAGIGIGSDSNQKTFLYEHNGGTNPSLKSSENLNVAAGKVYQIAETERLSADTLSVGTGATVHSPASNTLILGTNAEERLRIDSSGRLLVGTTSSSGDHILQVNSGTDNEGIKVVSTDAGSYIRFADNSTTAQIRLGAVGDDFKIDVNASERLRITSAGKFGFGTPNPQGTVHISSGTSGDATLILEADTDNNNEADNPYIVFRQDGGINASAIGHGVDSGINGNVLTIANSITDGAITFATGATNGYTNATERLRITRNGKVGIGTDIPEYDLDLGESASTIRLVSEDGGTAIRIGPGGDSNDITLIRVDGASNAHDGQSNSAKLGFSLKYMGSRSQNANSLSLFSDNQQAGTQIEAVTVFQDGTVGINSTIPSERLDVAGTTQTEQLNVTGISTFASSRHSFVTITRSSNGTALQLINTSTADGASVDHSFVIDGSTRARIRGNIHGGSLGGNLRFFTTDDTQTLVQRGIFDKNGRFGINVTSPTKTLDVGGNAKISGDLEVTGSHGLSSKYTHQKITSSGSATETLNQDGRTATDIIIFVNGIAFLPTDDYSVSGTTLTFVEAPSSGAVISVRYLPT